MHVRKWPVELGSPDYRRREWQRFSVSMCVRLIELGLAVTRDLMESFSSQSHLQESTVAPSVRCAVLNATTSGTTRPLRLLRLPVIDHAYDVVPNLRLVPRRG